MLCLHSTSSDYLCYSNRTSRDDTLLFGSTPTECMSVWEAARCTCAAPYYFKPLIWQGKSLLDGALKLICPAARAKSEAESIWPDKRCDVLLSLGTGTSPNSPPKHNNVVTVGKAGDIMDASRAWAKFCHGNPQRHILFRLNPSYQNEFALDDVKKLNEIQTQTEEWILSKNEEVNHICDQLIAALFYFCPSDGFDGVLVGTIFCRLPPTVGQKFIQDIHQKANLNSDLPLFAVKHHGIIFNVTTALRNALSSDELCFELTCHGVPIAGEIKIEMRGLLQTRYPWFPISGSPYNIPQKLHMSETLAKVMNHFPSRSTSRTTVA